MKVNIEYVVKNHLCLSCGSCAGLCPQNAISMIETAGGLLIAKVNNSRCNYCGLCAKVCPGSHLEKGLVSADTDPFKGNVIGAYCGQATDESILQNGQSGGIVTALLCHLLDSSRIYQAVVTRMPEDGSLRPESIVTADHNTIYRSQGSEYCPVALCEIVHKKIPRLGEKVAVVGLPCHIHALANAQVHLGGSVPFRIGLVCDRTLAFGAIDYLVNKVNVSRQDVLFFQFRSKKFNGWPGDGYVREASGREHCVSNKHRKSIKDIYTSVRCRLCFDKMNTLSDLVIGDAWGVREDRRGYSVIMVRTAKGQEAILSAQREGILQLENVNVEAIFKGQAIEKRRRDWTAFMTVWRNEGRPVPDFNVDERWYANIAGTVLNPYRNKISWAMELANISSNAHLLKAAKRKVLFQVICTSLSVRGLKKLVKRAAGLLKKNRECKAVDSY
jgi:coenzyme F420 hydrogenase subunit beta